MIERLEFGKVMAALGAMYPRWDIAEETITAYYSILGDLPLELLKAATLEYSSRGEHWPPSAGQLRAVAFDLLEQDEHYLSPGEAWAEVTKIMRLDGHWRVPKFSSPLIARAVDAIGGWRYINLSPEDIMYTHRARFLQTYETLQKRERADRRMLPQVRELARRLSVGPHRLQIEEP